MTDKNIQEAKVGSGTAVANKDAEKRAQLTLKSIKLRIKQQKEREALASQKKAVSTEETVVESFSPSQIAALKAEYSKINTIDPSSDTYKKLIAMLDRLDLKSLKSLAGAEVKFVSKLAQNRVLRKSVKEDLSIVPKCLLVQLDELSNDKLADYKKKAGADATAADKAGDTKKGNKRFSGIMKATKKQFDNDAKQGMSEASQRVDSLVTDALKIMQGSELKDAVQALKTVLGDREYNGRRGFYNFYVKQLVDMYGKKTNEELSPKEKTLDKNKNGKIDGSDLAAIRNKKKPQGADFAAQRRKERLASNGRMDEEVKVGDKVSFNHPMKAIPGKTMKKVGTVHKVEDGTVHIKVKDKYGVITHKKTSSELTKEEFDIGEESINEKSDYEVYHKDYSSAVQTAIKQAEKRGYEVDMDDWHDKVATGPKKPSSGKTNSFSINLMKDGKPSKKKLQMQVYNMDNHKYELNMYIEEIQLDELNKDTLHSYAKKSEKDQDDQYNKIGKGIRDNDPKSANKAGHKFSMRSIGQNRAEKRLAKEAASPAQQAAIAIAMKKAGKKPKNMKEGIISNIKDKLNKLKRGNEAQQKADDHFDKAGDPKNANASKDLKKAVRYHNLLNKEQINPEAKKLEKGQLTKSGVAKWLAEPMKKEEAVPEFKSGGSELAKKFNKAFKANGVDAKVKIKTVGNVSANEEVVTEAKKKTWKDMIKKVKNEEVPNKATIKKGDDLSGKREPIEIDPELKDTAK